MPQFSPMPTPPLDPSNQSAVAKRVVPDDDPKVLRQVTFDDIIGQRPIKQAMQMFIEASLMRKTALAHVLLKGRPGLGKTTFAHAIAHALEKEVVSLDGPSVTQSKLDRTIALDLAPDTRLISRSGLDLPLNLPQKVLIIDEVHAVPREGLELLYPLMEDFTYQNRKIPPFTLIGATTDPGKLPAPFRDRFGIDFTIDYYPVGDLVEIGEHAYRKLGHPDTDQLEPSLKTIAIRSHGTPRTMLRLLNRCLDIAAVKGTTLDTETVAFTMRMLSIDKYGLDELDRRILLALAQYARPVGVGAIASAVGEAADTIENVNEPWLVRAGFMERTQRGRQLTSPIGVMIVSQLLDGNIDW